MLLQSRRRFLPWLSVWRFVLSWKYLLGVSASHVCESESLLVDQLWGFFLVSGTCFTRRSCMGERGKAGDREKEGDILVSTWEYEQRRM